MTLHLALYAVPLALLMSVRAYHKGSLSRSGALCALLTGSVALTASLRLGVVLLVFFISSSKATRVGAKRKAELEGREYAGPGGRRTAVQVLANSASASAIALCYLLLRLGALDALLQRWGTPDAESSRWGPWQTEARLSFAGAARLPSLLQLAYVCHYACCNADSWASELGVLAGKPPRLITSWRIVRPGTNGAVSPQGLAASLAGGLLVGVAFWLAGLLLLLPVPQAAAAGSPGRVRDAEWLVLVLAPLAGLFGSGLDSLLGAELQFSGYCSERQCVVERPGPSVFKICGRPFLNNHAVNFLSALLTSAGAVAVVAACT
ncbi:integral membrane protein DUF92-domain-containing protein [Pavlovales sp. CCMP2436]|nr:integral membrane protein DUF92-domain-containing protein [Pavlovales sp. CCMP2436]KAJ1622916.1 integral membrane protein DUF92-domain-containing protein [Pavlovales sp. CCMP2436]